MLSLNRIVILLSLSLPFIKGEVIETGESSKATASIKQEQKQQKDPANIANDMKYEDSTNQKYFDNVKEEVEEPASSEILIPKKKQEVLICPDKFAKTCEQDGYSLTCIDKKHDPFQGICPRTFTTKVVKTTTTNTSGSEQPEVIESHVITILTTTTETSSTGFIASVVTTETITVTTDAKGNKSTSSEKSSSSSVSSSYTSNDSSQHNHNKKKKGGKKGQYEEIGDVAGALGA